MAANRIEVEARSVYGNTLIYPVNEGAKILAALIGKKTIGAHDLELAKALGCEVVEVHTAKVRVPLNTPVVCSCFECGVERGTA